MRVLALDLGTVRIGVAASAGVLATPITTLRRSADRSVDHRAIADLVAAEGAELVLVGWPRNMDGSHGPAAVAASEEAAELRAVLDVPVELVDERLTTVAADRALTAQPRRGGAKGRRRVIDQTAAAVLLQGWLDGRGAR